MNIQDLKSNTTWKEASNTINNNNNKISLAIATLENATLKNKGYFTTLEKLKEAIPNPTIGSKAYVGTSEPYAIYIVENGAWVDSGYTGGDEIVAKITTDRISNGAVTSDKLSNGAVTTEKIADNAVTTEKIATSAFDSTLSVSGKIAPADVVGKKLNELDEVVDRIVGEEEKSVAVDLIEYTSTPIATMKAGSKISSVSFETNSLYFRKDADTNITLVGAGGEEYPSLNSNNLTRYHYPLTISEDVHFLRSGATQQVTIVLAATEGILDSKVDKVTGKELSSNDFTNSYKSSLDDYIGSYRKSVESFTPITPYTNQEIDVIPSSAKITELSVGDNGLLYFKDENLENITITSANGISETVINGINFNKGLFPLPFTISCNIKYVRLAGSATDNNIRIVGEWGEYGDKRYVESVKAIELNTNANLEKFGNVGKIPMATWVDDDGVIVYGTNQGVHHIVKPICEELGIKPTIAVIKGGNYVVDGETVSQADYLKERQREGWHMTAHPNHTGWYGSGYDFSKVEPGLIDIMTYLQENKFLHSDMLVYPGSSSTISEVVEVVKRWCECAIKAGLGNPNHLGDSTKWQIQRTFIDLEACYSVYNGKSGFTDAVNWYKAKIDSAYANGDWIIFGTHSSLVVNSDDTSNPNVTTKGNIKLILEYAKSKMNFYTLWDAWNRRKILFDMKEICY